MSHLNPGQEKHVKTLIKELNFHPLAAKVYVENNGKCIYCGQDLLETGLEYYSGVIDRLLPKSKYPELEWDENNAVLSCYSCSNIKGDYDVCDGKSQNAAEMLANCKAVLIEQIMNELSKRAQIIENERFRVKQIVRG